MALEVSEPEQFWNGKLVLSWIDSLIFMPARALQLSPLTPAPELQAIVSKPCDSEDAIDDALREYLSLTTQHKGDKFEPRTPGRSARSHDRSLTLGILWLQMNSFRKTISRVARINSSRRRSSPLMRIMCAGRSSTVSYRYCFSSSSSCAPTTFRSSIALMEYLSR